MEKATGYTIREDMKRHRQLVEDFAHKQVNGASKSFQDMKEFLNRMDAEADEIRKQSAEYLRIKNEEDQRAQNEKENLERLRKQLMHLQYRESQLPVETEAVIKQQAEKKAVLAQQLQELEKLKGDKAYKEKEYAKGRQFFQQRLGLDFVCGAGTVTIVFTSIDPKNPARKFTVKLIIDENTQYQATGCEPALPNIDSMVDNLNATNQFSFFVQSVRRQFKKLVVA